MLSLTMLSCHTHQLEHWHSLDGRKNSIPPGKLLSSVVQAGEIHTILDEFVQVVHSNNHDRDDGVTFAKEMSRCVRDMLKDPAFATHKFSLNREQMFVAIPYLVELLGTDSTRDAWSILTFVQLECPTPSSEEWQKWLSTKHSVKDVKWTFPDRKM